MTPLILNAAIPVVAVRQQSSFSCDAIAFIRYDLPVPAVPYIIINNCSRMAVVSLCIACTCSMTTGAGSLMVFGNNVISHFLFFI